MENKRFHFRVNAYHIDGYPLPETVGLIRTTDRLSTWVFGPWIEVERVKIGRFVVVNHGILPRWGEPFRGYHRIGFESWDDEVIDLDPDESCQHQLWNISDHLRWNEVDLTPAEFRAPSVARLVDALSHVTFVAWDTGDI